MEAPGQHTPNDDQEYSPPPLPAFPPSTAVSPSAFTRFRITIPTGWHLDASQALQDTVSEPLMANQSHVANEVHARSKELFNIRTSYLETLIRRVAAAIPLLPGTATTTVDHPPTGDPDLDAFLAGGPDHNPYTPFAASAEDMFLLGPVCQPPICTLVLEVDTSALKTPHWPLMHRLGLPEVALSDLSAMGLTHLVQVLAEEQVARQTSANNRRGQGGKS